MQIVKVFGGFYMIVKGGGDLRDIRLLTLSD